MTPDERDLLSTFLRDLDGRRGIAKDGEAAAMIDQAVARNGDAAYLLVQHAIVSDRALHAAQARIAELEEASRQQQPAPAAQGGFLSNFAGPWGRQPDAGQQAQPGAFSGGGGGLGSFLRQAGTTAAGVAGGQFLFEGLSNMFGGHERGLFGGGGDQGFLGGGQEVTINNYGDDAGGGYDPDPGDDGNW